MRKEKGTGEIHGKIQKSKNFYRILNEIANTGWQEFLR